MMSQYVLDDSQVPLAISLEVAEILGFQKWPHTLERMKHARLGRLVSVWNGPFSGDIWIFLGGGFMFFNFHICLGKISILTLD